MGCDGGGTTWLRDRFGRRVGDAAVCVCVEHGHDDVGLVDHVIDNHMTGGEHFTSSAM
jgi:hypothetical protein